ncbi:hypothetical protein N9137_01115 [Pseudomonadales bacterium]|nr:hypothetical protein [Pseudomonadales bacterium]
MTNKVKFRGGALLPNNSRAFIKMAGDCCYQPLCEVTITTPDQTYELLEQRTLDCDNNEVVINQRLGSKSRAEIEFTYVRYVEEDVLSEWFDRGCPADIIFASGECEKPESPGDADILGYVCGALPISRGGAQIGVINSSELANEILRTIGGSGIDYSEFHVPSFGKIPTTFDGIVTHVAHSQQSGCTTCGGQSKGSPCALYAIAEKDPVTCHCTLHIYGCDCAGRTATINLGAELLDIAPTRRGWVVLTIEDNDPASLGATNWSLIPYDGACDHVPCEPQRILATTATSASSNGRIVYAVGENGHASNLNLDSGYVETILADFSVVESYLAVDSYNDIAVAVGENGLITFFKNVYNSNYTSAIATTITPPDVGVGLNAVSALDAVTFIVGTDDGRIFITRDCGVSWEQICVACGLPALAEITHIENADSEIFYVTAIGTDGLVKIFASFNGGCDCTPLPRGKSPFVAMDSVTDMSVCSSNASRVLISGQLNGDNVVAAS